MVRREGKTSLLLNNFNKINQLKVMNQFNHRPLEVTKLSLTREQAINKFLSSRQGLAYLSMKYPNLSVSDAVSEYKKNAL